MGQSSPLMGLIHHIEINVSNLQRSKEFWSDILSRIGYSLFQEWDMGFSWQLGQSYLVFVQTAERFLEATYHRGHTGLNHLAFWAASRKQVDEMKSLLEEKGTKILYPERYPYAGGNDYYALYFEDPDRIKVELVAPV